MSFVALHAYSGYSFLKSGLKLDQYVKQAKKFGYSAIGLSDLATLSGAPRFAHLAIEAGLKPIIGEDFHVDNLDVSLFVLNEIGYRNLLYLNSLYEEGQLSFVEICKHSEGIAVILPLKNDALKAAYISQRDKFPHKLATISKGIKHFYLGIGFDDEMSFVEEMRQYSEHYSYTTIAFPSIKYLTKNDAIVLKMMESIESKEILEYKTLEGKEYLLNQEEIESFYTKEEILETERLASLVDFDLFKKRGKMIHFENNLGLSSDDYLKKIALEGLAKNGKTSDVYIKRLEHETDVIKKMGYSDYFLIVHDFVNFAKRENIAIGPGRGSAAGSLVSYALGITVPDPIENNLIFERFLNEHRQTMPDIDIDFSDTERERIVDYISTKYGPDHVSKILAIQKIGSKQALNDVGRIFNYEKRDIELFTKLIKDEDDDKLSLREIYKNNVGFRNLVNDDKYYLEIVSLASKIEGLPRQSSLHAAGIVLNAEPLKNVIPLSKIYGGGYVEQFEKDYLEEQGFLKMDILALRNLTIVENCLNLLKRKSINLTRDDLPYDDQEAIDLIANEKTIGIFQLESKGMRRAIRTLKIKTFEDVIALIALFRPAAMGEIEEYAKYKNTSREVKYISPALKNILESTYGQIVYQEQVMNIVSAMAGFSLAEADIFRRAISKKDSSKIAKTEKAFIDGSIRNGYKKEDAEKIFKIIYRFSGYGFNKSHAMVYAIFSCRMAYLKAHYPLEFYASILSNASSEEFNNTISEMKSVNIKVRCPDINTSTSNFEIVDEEILFPLNSVKGISTVSASNIIKERSAGKFKDIYDFVIRMKKYRFNDSNIIALIDSGSFDSFGYNRPTLRKNLINVLKFADTFGDETGSNIFDIDSLPKPSFEIVESDNLLDLEKEQQVLGMMVSGSPLDSYKEKMEQMHAISLENVKDSRGNIKIFAIIKNIKRIVTKKGQNMAFLLVYDNDSEMEITLFPEPYLKSLKALKKNLVVIIEGYFRNGELNVARIIDAKENENE